MTDTDAPTAATTASSSPRTTDASLAASYSLAPTTSRRHSADPSVSATCSGPCSSSSTSNWAAQNSHPSPMSLQMICNPFDVEQNTAYKASGEASPRSVPVMYTPNSSLSWEATLGRPAQPASDGQAAFGEAVERPIPAKVNQRSKQLGKSQKLEWAKNCAIARMKPSSYLAGPDRMPEVELELEAVHIEQEPTMWLRTSMWVGSWRGEPFGVIDWNQVRRRVEVSALPSPPRELPLLPGYF